MQQEEAHILIATSPLFRGMQPNEIEAIFARLQHTQITHGTNIIERAVWHGKLYIIVSGEVNVLLQEDNYEVARLSRGECFGEMSLITGEPPTATIRTAQDVTLLSLAQTDFLALVGTCPTLLQNINTILSQRLARANQQLLSAHTAEVVLLSELAAPDQPTLPTPSTHSLAIHIAAALAARTHKRILLLELCSEEDASSPRFAQQPQQQRPTLFDCIHNRQLLQHHHTASVSHGSPQNVALMTLAATHEQAQAIDATALPILADLMSLYDYVLLAANANTPPHIIPTLIESNEAVHAYSLKRKLTLLPAPSITKASQVAQLASVPPTGSVFVTQVAEKPTIGVQDRYAALLGREVARLLPADTTLLERSWQQQQTLYQLAPDAVLSQAVDFVARTIARQTVGIAFGGGGARGFAHLGVLDGLLAHHVPIDYIAACSSGIITPGMHLIGKTIAESEEIFMEIQRHIVQWRLPRTSIFSNRGLKHMLRELCGDCRFEDLTTPFAMVAIDLTTRSGVVLDRGPLWQAGLASVALPGIFPPVIVGQHILMDAGMHDPVPIRLVRKMGADILLASELGGQEPPSLQSATPWLLEGDQQEQIKTPHIVDLLLRTYDLAMATIGMHSIREADVVIRPKLHRVSLRQFSEGRKFVAAGREAVETMLPTLQQHLPWLT